MGRRLLLLVALIVGLCSAAPSHAAISLVQPADGLELVAEACPFQSCSASLGLTVSYTAGVSVARIVVIATPDAGGSFENLICSLPDPIEPGGSSIPRCPDGPETLVDDTRLSEGGWTLVARATRAGVDEFSAPVRVTVRSPYPAVGPIDLTRFTPTSVDGEAITPESSIDFGAEGDQFVFIEGSNLDRVASLKDRNGESLLRVYLAPIPPGEPTLTVDSGLDAEGRWCLVPLELDEGSFGPDRITVKLPRDLPLDLPSRCGDAIGPSGPAFAKRWRFVIHDRLDDENHPRLHGHQWWAIPSPRAGVAWRDHPPFEIDQPAYPHIFGFGFDNEDDSSSHSEFTSVYGNNAYHCVGAFGRCVTRIPDPIYHIVWYPLYKLLIEDSGGTCVGMASTSRLLANRALGLGDYLADDSLLYPVQVEQPDGLPSDPRFTNDYQARFENSNSCSPFCSPKRPGNLWSKIRQNHGKQISREVVAEILGSLGSTVVDPTDVGSVRGIPEVALDRVRNNPDGYVLCMTGLLNGHCVTPYRVDDNAIHVYDNNYPRNRRRRSDGSIETVNPVITVQNGEYFYPVRGNGELSRGRGLYAHPIGIFNGSVNLLGLGDFDSFIGGDVVRFFQAIIAGDADALITNESGDRWGWESDGAFADDYAGAVALPVSGPGDVANRHIPVMLPNNRPAPRIQLESTGGRYLAFFGQEGQLMQLEATQTESGDAGYLQLAYDSDNLVRGFDFSPAHSGSNAVPRVGMVMDEDASGVYSWLGLDVPARTTVSFSGNRDERSVSYANETGRYTQHLVALDYAYGPDEASARMLYGPFRLPPGATQTLEPVDWPSVDEVLSVVDLDGDGVPDSSRRVPGLELPTPLPSDLSADVAISLQSTVEDQDGMHLTLRVDNFGPDAAQDVTVLNLLPDNSMLVSWQTDAGQCAETAAGGRCDLGSLEAETHVKITATVLPATAGKVQANVTAVAQGLDPDLTNNDLTATLARDLLFAHPFE